MLHLSRDQFAQIVAQGLAGKPLEVCGLLAGRQEGEHTFVEAVYPAHNDDQSEKTYTVNARDFMRVSVRLSMHFDVRVMHDGMRSSS